MKKNDAKYTSCSSLKVGGLYRVTRAGDNADLACGHDARGSAHARTEKLYESDIIVLLGHGAQPKNPNSDMQFFILSLKSLDVIADECSFSDFQVFYESLADGSAQICVRT